MGIEGWYYLHTNKDLIYKRELGGTAADIRESDFAIMLWPFDPSDRAGAWNILVEASALGAKPERIKELAEKWGCNDEDAKHYAEFVGAKISKDDQLWKATRKDYVDVATSLARFGRTALEALAELCKELGYKPQKTWGATFKDLLK